MNNDESSSGVRNDARAAAERVLMRNGIPTDPTLRTAQFDFLTAMYEEWGRDRFELYFNLRHPTDRQEQWARDLMWGQISQDQLRSNLKADAERPVDLEMLTTFHEFWEERLQCYSRFLQEVVEPPAGGLRRESIRDRELAATRYLGEACDAKAPLWRENLQSVFEFLDEIRVESGLGLAIVDPFEATSAHWLLVLVIMRTSEAWRSCQEIAEHSRTDSRYLYATTASRLFQSVWLDKLPIPQKIAEQLRVEFTHAKLALRRRQSGSGSSGGVAAQHECSARAAAVPAVTAPQLPVVEEIGSMAAKPHVVAFMTYSWADEGNEERVERLAASLRRDGIDCDIDKWDQVKGEGLPRWMTDKIRDADIVLCVCTESYCRRFEGREEPGKGLGANFEGKMIAQAIHDAGGKNEKFIPVLFTPEDSKHIPEVLKGAIYYVLSGQSGYEELYGRITGQPSHVAPPLGPVRTLPSREAQPSFAPAGSTAVGAAAAPAALQTRHFDPIGVESDFSPDAAGGFLASWQLTTLELTPDEWLGVRVRLEVTNGNGTIVAVGDWVEARGYAGRWETQRVPAPPVPGPGEHLMLARVESNDPRYARTFEPRQFVNRRQTFVAVPSPESPEP